RVRVELAGRLHRVPAPQDGGGRQAATDPDGPRGRGRPARAISFRARLAIDAAAAVALAVVLASVAVYVVVRNELRGTLDSALRDRAAQVQHEPLRGFPAGG